MTSAVRDKFLERMLCIASVGVRVNKYVPWNLAASQSAPEFLSTGMFLNGKLASGRSHLAKRCWGSHERMPSDVLSVAEIALRTDAFRQARELEG